LQKPVIKVLGSKVFALVVIFECLIVKMEHLVVILSGLVVKNSGLVVIVKLWKS